MPVPRGPWSVEQLVALLPQIASSALATSWVERAVHLLVRSGRASDVGEVAACFGRLPLALESTMVSSFLAIVTEQSPQRLAELLTLLDTDRSKNDLVRSAVKLGLFAELASATKGWSTRELIGRLPYVELDEVKPASFSPAVAFCRDRGLRHPLVYRDLARRQDLATLLDHARETAALDVSDSNGGFARRSFMPWAYASVVRETFAVGALEACDAMLALMSDGAMRRAGDLEWLIRALEVAYARRNQPRVARDGDLKVDAALRLVGGVSVADAFAGLPAPADEATWARWVALFWEVRHTRDLKQGWQASMQLAPHLTRERRALVTGWQSDLLREFAARWQYDEARAAIEQLDDRDHLTVTLAYETACRGAKVFARSLLATLPSEWSERYQPLLVDDWATTTLPPDADFDAQLSWVMVALEATYGRSKTATGFGIAP